jgi:hypothetical protein
VLPPLIAGVTKPEEHAPWTTKLTIHLVGLKSRRPIVLRQKLSPGQVVVRLAKMQPCLVGMEACVGAHHLSCSSLATT